MKVHDPWPIHVWNQRFPRIGGVSYAIELRTNPLPPVPVMSDPRNGKTTANGPRRLRRTLVLIVMLSVFWIVLSGRLGLQYFIFMAASIAIVLATNPDRPFAPNRSFGERVGSVVHFFRYLFWLLWNVLKANIEVAARILHPRMPIRPQLMIFRSPMKSDVGRVVVANSMTLTPGTITVDLKGDRFLVHALHPVSAGAVTEAHLQNAVGPLFGEEREAPPRVKWYSSYRDIPLDRPEDQ